MHDQSCNSSIQTSCQCKIVFISPLHNMFSILVNFRFVTYNTTTRPCSKYQWLTYNFQSMNVRAAHNYAMTCQSPLGFVRLFVFAVTLWILESSNLLYRNVHYANANEPIESTIENEWILSHYLCLRECMIFWSKGHSTSTDGDKTKSRCRGLYPQ